MELIKLAQVSIGYAKGRPLLPPITFALGAGDLVGVLGPNGAGKSTFLKTLLGLLPPLSGEISWPAGRPPRLGYVPQNARPDMAFPLSSLQVVLMGRAQQLGLVKRPGEKDRELARAALKEVSLEQVAQQPFRSLSGGQQQRVLVARALVADPELLVLDEPTSEMDPAAEHGLLSLVSELSMTRKIGVIFVTHEISSAAGFGKQVVLIDANAQRFESGTAEEMVTSEQMTKLYGRPVEIRRENGRVLVWVAARNGEGAPR